MGRAFLVAVLLFAGCVQPESPDDGPDTAPLEVDGRTSRGYGTRVLDGAWQGTDCTYDALLLPLLDHEVPPTLPSPFEGWDDTSNRTMHLEHLWCSRLDSLAGPLDSIYVAVVSVMIEQPGYYQQRMDYVGQMRFAWEIFTNSATLAAAMTDAGLAVQVANFAATTSGFRIAAADVAYEASWTPPTTPSPLSKSARMQAYHADAPVPAWIEVDFLGVEAENTAAPGVGTFSGGTLGATFDPDTRTMTVGSYSVDLELRIMRSLP